MNLEGFFDKLNKLSLCFLLFFIPLLFFPFTQNFLDFPKQFISLVLIFISLIGWTGKQVLRGKLTLRKNTIFYFAFFLIFLSSFLSILFSPNFQSSFWGSPLEVNDSFLTIILLLVLVSLVPNSFEKKSDFLEPLFFLFLGTSFACLLNFFQVYKIYLFPFDVTKTPAFNTIGSQNSLSLFVVILLPLCLILFLKAKGWIKIILGIIFSLLFLNVVLVDFKTAWLLLLIETLMLFTFAFKEKIKIGFLFILMAIIVVSIFFYLFPLKLPPSPNLPLEVSLSLPSEINILKSSLSENLKNLTLGTGPGTFVFNYSRYHSPALNQTIFWGTRFTKGYSVFFDWIITRGIIWGISIIFLYCLILFFVFQILTDKEGSFFDLKLGLSSALFSAIIGSIFYPFNFSLNFLFWFLLGGFLLFISKKTEINLSSFSKRIVLFNFIFALLITFYLGLIFIQGERCLAEINYYKALKIFQNEKNLDKTIRLLKRAISLNPSFDLYWRDLSQVFLNKVKLYTKSQNPTPQEKRKMNLAIVEGGNAINKAIEIMPNNVANWNVRGFFYRSLIGTKGAEKIAIESYQKAAQLEPSSPFPWTEKARVYILVAQNKEKKEEQEKNLRLAQKSLEKAISLKPDYTPAHYLLAVVFDQLGKSDLAISKLKEIETISPQDCRIPFQLGIMYWRKGEIEKAKKEFEKSLEINNKYLNAKYMLGLVYDREGKKEKAREIFEKLLEKNPENQEIKKILENIKNGLPALEGIIASQSIPQQLSPEIK